MLVWLSRLKPACFRKVALTSSAVRPNVLMTQSFIKVVSMGIWWTEWFDRVEVFTPFKDVEQQTCNWKIMSSNPGKSGQRIFCSRVKFLCWLLFSVCSTPCYQSGMWKIWVILQRVQVTGSILTSIQPRPSEVRVGGLCCPGVEWEPIREMSPHTTQQATHRHSHLNSLSHCGPILV